MTQERPLSYVFQGKYIAREPICAKVVYRHKGRLIAKEINDSEMLAQLFSVSNTEKR